jgi:hypothetical protein
MVILLLISLYLLVALAWVAILVVRGKRARRKPKKKMRLWPRQ